MGAITDNTVLDEVRETVQVNQERISNNLDWLKTQLHNYFFLSNYDEVDAIANLASGLNVLEKNRRITLVDRDDLLMIAQVGVPGSLYRALSRQPGQDISYAQINTTTSPIPGTEHPLEVLRFDYGRKEDSEIRNAPEPEIPRSVVDSISAVLASDYPDFDISRLNRYLKPLWLNSETYVRNSPPERISRVLNLYAQTEQSGGVYLDIQDVPGSCETRLLFGVFNPPQKRHLLQIMEVFKRLGIGVKRSYSLVFSNGTHPCFMATFYVKAPQSAELTRESELFRTLRKELYNTQILAASSNTYNKLVTEGVVSGQDGALINAMIGFCHTSLAHANPDAGFDMESIERAFLNHPDVSLQLVDLFWARFSPWTEDRETRYAEKRTETRKMIDDLNTGRNSIDEFRRKIFNCAFSFIANTLKTNFFVEEKHALSFRLDPAYLEELGPEFTADLPPERPFRITFFYSRNGLGYHIGFSDIARGGWRTLITSGRDDYAATANTVFRENYVLAHTQHLKNKDIYEGGSKMVAILSTVDKVLSREAVIQRLYRLQYGFINAFLDIYATRDGRPMDPNVVDYYGEDEPIELGPDENMHDNMIELIARLAVKRGYLLGSGIMSSKKIGINHKEYAVTSTGVVKFAEITMKELGIDMHNDPFSVKFTGGPNGDVAGNGMNLLLDRCAQVQFRLIIDGTGALYDPEGADHDALRKIVLQADVESFDSEALHPGGYIIYRQQTRMDGMRKTYRKVQRTDQGLEELWISNDEFYRDFNRLVFTTKADLFIPAGGRPETIDGHNWQQFFDAQGTPSARAIVEGANSFITPEARIELQKKGVVIIRDASANKCGVISSSYEIIANLLMSDEEFLASKEQYVADVVTILNVVAEEEARLIFKRHREAGGHLLYTEISDQISQEINAHYARLFNYFQRRPHVMDEPEYKNAMIYHLPDIIGQTPELRERIDTLPLKVKCAMLASEVASSLVYIKDEDQSYEQMVKTHLKKLPDVSGLLGQVKAVQNG